MSTTFTHTAIAVAIVAASLVTGCTRIETGEVGLRIDMSKQTQGTELMPGTWNQLLIGEVLTFPTKDISINLENKTPLTADNSTLADLDLTVVYAINPTSVSDLYTTKSRSFHAASDVDKHVTWLMYNYMTTLVNNATYKAIRQYKALEVADNRAKLEEDIRRIVTEQLKTEKLDTALSLTVVQIRNIAPNKSILDAATDYVRVQNALLTKQAEVDIARQEAIRMQVLAANSVQSIAYMNAQANLTIAEAIKAGKVNTIIVPHGMTMLGNLK